MQISRRAMLGTAIGAAAVATPVLGSAAFAADGQTGTASDDPFAATLALELKGLPTREQMWDWQMFHHSLGPTLTGNPGHVAYVDFLAREMAKLPGFKVSRDTVKFENGGRWSAQRCALDLMDGKKSKPLVVTSYFPYSGSTPAAGIEAEVVYGGRTPDLLKGDYTGKIVLVDAPVAPVVWEDRYDRWGATEDTLQIETSSEAIYQQYCAPDLKQFKDQGAVGVIAAWEGVSDANAKDQYIPFGKKRHDIPGLWVGEKTGAEIKAAIARKAKVRMVLEAEVYPDATTDNVIATLPGDSDETVLLFTHTDGNNATEENGGLALIAIANHLATLPRRRRTYSFIFDTGHMAIAQVPVILTFAERFQDIVSKTVVGLAIEHLGAREWAQDKQGNYLPTGKNAISWMLTDRKYLADLTLACSRSLVERTLVVNPVQKRFNGEGGALYRTGKPTMGYLPVPEWLLTSPPSGEIEKMDADLLYAQTVAMTRIARHLDTFDLNLIAA